MAEERPEYLAYLLRLWRGSGKKETVWRASLQVPDTRERVGFASLEELFDFLRQKTVGPRIQNEQGGTQEKKPHRNAD